MESARIIIEVVAGLIPGKDPDPEFTKRFVISSQEWADAAQAEYADPSSDGPSTEGRIHLLGTRNREALDYAAQLMMRPDRLNWVRTDWIYL